MVGGYGGLKVVFVSGVSESLYQQEMKGTRDLKAN